MDWNLTRDELPSEEDGQYFLVSKADGMWLTVPTRVFTFDEGVFQDVEGVNCEDDELLPVEKGGTVYAWMSLPDPAPEPDGDQV